jgi:hypothetical protein
MSNANIYLLSIKGTLASPTLEASRGIHNDTAGAPANVAAARSLGDLSHMVYVPTHAHNGSAKDFLILDQWNSMEGLNQFFANPHVQEQAGQIFSDRDPVVWAPAEGFASYHFPAPHGQNDRLVAVVRGKVKSIDEARAVHNGIVEMAMNAARKAGDMSHEAYLRMAAPGSPESLEFLAVDVWSNAAGMGEFYSNPQLAEGFKQLFVGEPSATTWVHPTGEWVEW